jgi:hypothetical protein
MRLIEIVARNGHTGTLSGIVEPARASVLVPSHPVCDHNGPRHEPIGSLLEEA